MSPLMSFLLLDASPLLSKTTSLSIQGWQWSIVLCPSGEDVSWQLAWTRGYVWCQSERPDGRWQVLYITFLWTLSRDPLPTQPTWSQEEYYRGEHAWQIHWNKQTTDMTPAFMKGLHSAKFLHWAPKSLLYSVWYRYQYLRWTGAVGTVGFLDLLPCHVPMC